MNQEFSRDLNQLSNVFSFLDNFAEDEEIGQPVVLPVRLAIEELFTNMVRHNAESRAEIAISLKRVGDKVVVVLTDTDVQKPFDPTRHGEVDTSASLDEREAGGLGIHLVKRMVDEINYHYSARDRKSRITLEKSILPHA